MRRIALCSCHRCARRECPGQGRGRQIGPKPKARLRISIFSCMRTTHVFMHAQNTCFHACAQPMFCMRTASVVFTHAHSHAAFTRAHANGRSFVRFTRAMRVMRALHCHRTGSDTRAAPGRASLVRFWSDALDHSIPGRKPGPVPGRKPGPESRALLANGGSGQGRPRFCACSRAHALVRKPSFAYTRARALFTRTRELHLHAPHTSPACQALPSTRFAIVNARTQEAV